MKFNFGLITVWFEQAVDWALANRVRVLQGLAGVAVLAIGVSVYQYIANQTRMAAHKELMELLRIVDEPVMAGEGVKAQAEAEKMTRIVTMADKKYQEYKSTPLAAAFLAIKADALDAQDKTGEAIAVMRQAVSAMSAVTVKNYYQLKLALMLMDQQDEAAQKEGLDVLRKMSNDPKNSAHDRSLYYLGYHAWINKQYSEAKNYWQQLVVKYGSERNSLELVEKAKEHLELLAV
jgi:hypothetical protein